jgi:glycine oxidase
VRGTQRPRCLEHRPRALILGTTEAEIKGSDVVVVGGGLIGLTIAREAAGRGASVVLVERAIPAREASWAAAGMLSPLGEASSAGPFLRLGLRSLGLFPGFVASLREASGIDPDLRRLDKLLVALTEEDEAVLESRRSWQASEGLDVRWLDAGALHRTSPAVSPEAKGALMLAGNGLVDPRALGDAAVSAAERAGVRFLVGDGAQGVLGSPGRVAGVALRGGGSIGAHAVVVAAGAWSGGLAGLPRPLPLRPVRGQMIALGTASALAAQMLSGTGVYLLPRVVDGRSCVWVGATVEEAGFDGRTTPEARETLRQAAARLLPALAEAPVVEHWAGLRPATPDELPIVGPDPEMAGLVYATGHFRNGILLAPVTAQLVGDVLDGAAPAELEPFRPERFDSDIQP